MVVKNTADAIVIGSGIGGLSCAALLARYGFEVLTCESHTISGGAAHSFQRNGFTFDSGPSLYSGLSYSPSSNPLRFVLDAVGEDIDWATYDTWGCCLPEGDFPAPIGADAFAEILAQLRGKEAVSQWRKLQQVMKPLGEATLALPSAALRYDLGAIFTLGRYFPAMLPHLGASLQLTGDFAGILEGAVSDRFLLNWLDLLCFLLSGLPAKGTSAAEMAFMFAEWYRPEVVLDYPMGGSGAIVDALVRGIQRYGGELRLGTRVAEILTDGDRATGVRLQNGEVIKARRGVISNISIWDTLKLLDKRAISTTFRQERDRTPPCPSFMHLHLGIDGTGLPEDLHCHYIFVEDWEKGVKAPQNVIAISIPSLLDPSLAPPGKHAIHVYTPATEPYELWEGMDRRSTAYQEQKEARSRICWKALERVIPDIRDRCELTLIGTPLTHERFLNIHRGTYGPEIPVTEGVFPSATTPLPGLLLCGASTFPGIGVPAVAASGIAAANTLAPVHKHLQLLN
ncbi:MAG: NAD(P)/FAD-dependent oxidoreductase [Cyanobacteria bacterium SBLK]|nr:NAD(P)/FAD-dependent oxidoreductase [Cyanobacteria bacterium SBLK]